MKESYPNVVWQSFDLKKDPIPQKAELVISSYVLNELDKASQLKAAEKLWQATEEKLIIIEPGTPTGFEIICQIRSHLIEQGAFVAAPCPHDKECPLQKDDWCHFTCRLARSQIHKILKGGDAPYEDEKFSYLILSHKPVIQSLLEFCVILILKKEMCNYNYVQQPDCRHEQLHAKRNSCSKLHVNPMQVMNGRNKLTADLVVLKQLQ